VRVLLISTYELGRQPFGLASPAAWLRAAGHDVACADLSVGPLPEAAAAAADLIATFLPMHTATRLFLRVAPKLRRANPRAHLCCYGLYATLTEAPLRAAGVATLIGGEFEEGLVGLARRLEAGESAGQAWVSVAREQFLVPERGDLPPLGAYARLVVNGSQRTVGYTEASRGCKHRCRHCPVVPVYNGVFRVVPREVVLEDIRRQVDAGARHITFGDPDFLNGPGHAIPLVEAFHERWPDLTYDVTVKVEHLLRHRDLLPVLRRTGCLFVTSAVESLDDRVLERLDKGHTREGFVAALGLMRAAGLTLAPTFIPFTPWTTMEGYRGFLRDLAALGLVGEIAPIQLAIRLLIPEGSRLLELEEVRSMAGPFDARSLAYPWRNPDPDVDRLAAALQSAVQREERRHASRAEAFRAIWDLAGTGEWPEIPLVARAAVPYLTEPWYC
jgi:radical SAM superfamily enzyme YgiQ (UPF0313 family)